MVACGSKDKPPGNSLKEIRKQIVVLLDEIHRRRDPVVFDKEQRPQLRILVSKYKQATER
jgi:hypothetical protein